MDQVYTVALANHVVQRPLHRELRVDRVVNGDHHRLGHLRAVEVGSRPPFLSKKTSSHRALACQGSFFFKGLGDGARPGCLPAPWST